jgi:hypothetical protein
MEENHRYSPPLAAVADEPSGLQAKPKRILALQVVIAFAALLMAWGIAQTVYGELSDNPYSAFGPTWHWYVSHILAMLASVGLIFLVQWRSQFARWSTVVWIVGCMVVPVVAEWPLSDRDLREIAMVYVPLALLLYFATFSMKARAYFSNSPGTARS